ncbi:MAG: HNH endonuclease [Acidobacteria bacterium]|nr:HNH endonuclease [Acidobacteriota bacterium]
MAQWQMPGPFQVDHVIAVQHGGKTEAANLALACPHCNRNKGPNIAGIDPRSGALVRLFNPRIDVWADHFRIIGGWIEGTSPIGRATAQVLNLNAAWLVEVRAALATEELL